MNHKNHGNNQPKSFSGAGQDASGAPTSTALTMNYGYTKESVVIIYSQRVEQITMTLEQVDAMIVALNNARAGHVAVAAGKPPPEGDRQIAPGGKIPS